MYNIYYIAESVPSCKIGNNQNSRNVAAEVVGSTYLNTLHPVSCALNITQWRYCYYTQAAPRGSTLSMTVAVWSLDVVTNTYIVNPSSIRNITIKPEQILANIFCEKVMLTEAEYIQASQRAVVGVFLPSDNAIPVLGYDSYSENYLMESSEFLTMSVTKLAFKHHVILHLYGTSSKFHAIM